MYKKYDENRTFKKCMNFRNWITPRRWYAFKQIKQIHKTNKPNYFLTLYLSWLNGFLWGILKKESICVLEVQSRCLALYLWIHLVKIDSKCPKIFDSFIFSKIFQTLTLGHSEDYWASYEVKYAISVESDIHFNFLSDTILPSF